MTLSEQVAYELARELISSRIGNASHEIGVEEAKPQPNQGRIAELEAEIVAYARLRESIGGSDLGAINSAIVSLSRDPDYVLGLLKSLPDYQER